MRNKGGLLFFVCSPLHWTWAERRA